MPARFFKLLLFVPLLVLLIGSCKKEEPSLPVSTGSITNTDIALNPNGFNPLSANLKVETTTESRIRIKLQGLNGEDSGVDRTFNTLDTIHSLTVLGLYPDHNNQLEVYAIDKNGRLQDVDTLAIMTSPLPSFFPIITVDVSEPERMEPGFTLISGRDTYDPNIPYMVDAYGHVRWMLDYSNHPSLNELGYDVGTERLQNGHFYFGDWTTNQIYEVDENGNILNSWDLQGFGFHHNVQEKPNGNFLVTVNAPNSTHLNGRPSQEDHIIEIDRQSGAILMTWDLRQVLDENRITMINNLSNPPVDWAHANAVIYDPSDHTIIVSCRYQGLIKLDYDGNLVWVLGPQEGYGQNRKGEEVSDYLLTPLDAAGQKITDEMVLKGISNHPDFEWNWFQHAPFLMDNGSIMLFDNGLKRNFADDEFYSRAVEYQIDEVELTVRQVWQYGKERGIRTHAPLVSDVDYLPEKGNILFSPGAMVFNGGFSFGAKVVELDYQSKEVVFEMRIEEGGYINYHRAERMLLYAD